MHPIYEQLIEILDRRELRYRPDPECICVRLDFEGAVGVNSVSIWFDPGLKMLQVVCFSPVRIPEGCRPSIAEAVVRANYGLRLGKFELNFDDGDLKFHVGQIITIEELDEDVFDRMVFGPVRMMDQYLPAFMSIIYANELPEEAVRIVEAVPAT